MRSAWPGAVVLSVLLVCAGCGEAEPPRGVVLVVLDTTRADHLGAYGYGRATSPNLDRLAAEAELYTNAFAQSPWTLPSIATMLTGLAPRRHGAGMGRDGRLTSLAPKVPTLPELLAQRGYRTGAVVNVIFCSPDSGLGRGFELYDFHGRGAANVGHRDAAATTDVALDWLERVRDEPFFLLVHYFDPHLTYDPPEPWDRRFAPEDAARIPPGFGSAADVFALRRGELDLDGGGRRGLVARYDGEIAFVDEEFGRLRRGLERLGRWRDTLLIVIGDHGEEFWDHGGFEHGHSHFRELMHVPLIVKRPGNSPAEQTGLARQLDVAPTVLDFAGVEIPDAMNGKVLDDRGAGYSIAEGSLWTGDLLSARGADGTLIVDRSSGRRWFFAPADRGETNNLAGAGGAGERRLGELLDGLSIPADQPGGSWQPTERQLERLRSLGYVE